MERCIGICSIKVVFKNFLRIIYMLHKIAFILVIIGGLNWLLVGVAGWDIGVLFGGMSALISKIVYILVGLSAIYLVVTHKNDCKNCMGMGKQNMGGGQSGGTM